MSSLKYIYESSNFYKEARIISFLDHLYMELMDKIKAKLPMTQAMFSTMDAEEFEDQCESALTILEKFKNGFFLDIMIDNNKNEVNTMDFLNFIRPDTRSSEGMYGISEPSVATPNFLSSEFKEVKWDDMLKGDSLKKLTKLDPIPEFKPKIDALNHKTPKGTVLNPRQKMKDEVKNKALTQKVEKSKSSSK